MSSAQRQRAYRARQCDPIAAAVAAVHAGINALHTAIETLGHLVGGERNAQDRDVSLRSSSPDEDFEEPVSPERVSEIRLKSSSNEDNANVTVSPVTPPPSLSLSDLKDLKSERESLPARAREVVTLDAELTPPLQAIATGLGVYDPVGTWKKFTGHKVGQRVHVAGAWQKWCVDEVRRQRERAPPNQLTLPSGEGFRPTRHIEPKAEAEYRRTAVPAPVGALLGALAKAVPRGDRAPPGRTGTDF